MNIKNILTNGLPEELANLKLGQVVIFSSPGEGMSEPNIRISQFISSVVKQLKKSGIHVDPPAVYVVPTENTNLWDCISCKVITNKKNVIELADKGSLTEMLYDYWGLDFNSLPKPVIINRYVSYQFFIADYHPYKICIEPIAIDPSFPRTRGADYDYDYDNVYDFDIDYDPTSFSLGVIIAKGKEPTARDFEIKIEEIMMEAEKYNKTIDLDRIRTNVNKQKKKSYILDIDIELNQHNKISKCDIILQDEMGEKNLVKLEAQEKAIYIAFILYNDGNGFRMTDFDYPNKQETKAFFELLKSIHEKMLNRNETKGMLDKKGVSEIRSRIKNKISQITQMYWQSFSIEGVKEGLYKIEASTDEIRDKIGEKLNL